MPWLVSETKNGHGPNLIFGDNFLVLINTDVSQEPDKSSNTLHIKDVRTTRKMFVVAVKGAYFSSVLCVQNGDKMKVLGFGR